MSNGSYKFLVRNDGNVGIGTTVPSKLLHLKTITGTNAEFDIQSGTKPLWGIYHDETSEELRFWNGSNRVVFGSGGNVGIGTTSPEFPLSIAGGSGSSLKMSISNLTPVTGHKWTLNSTSAGNFYLGDDTAGANRIAVDTAGNVGIGTTSPLEKLHLFSDITSGQLSPYMEVEETHPTNFATRYLTKYGTYNINTTLPSGTSAGLNLTVAGGDQTSGGGGISLKTNGTNTRMFIRQDGNVGIGTTSPGYKLDIREINTPGLFIGGSGGGSSYGFFEAHQTGGNYFKIQANT